MASSNLIFQITNTGVTAANNANQSGPKVNITAFKVGSAYNYTPAPGDTALHGTTLYTGGIAGYAVDTNDSVVFTIQMDQSVGSFSFGEIGLYDSNGNLFALGALVNPQEKVQASGSNAGNVVSFQIKLTLQNIAPAIQFTQTVSTNAQLLEVSGPDGLPVPGTNVPGNPNVFSIQGGDDAGQPILAVRETSAGLWAFSTHTTQIFSGSVTASSTASGINCSAVVASAFDFYANRYIIQFTSGVNKGTARYVGGFSNGQITTTTAFQNAPATNDTFVVYVSNYFRLSEYNFAVDSGSAGAYVLTTYPSINAPAAGMVFTFVAANTNAGACTVNIAGTNYNLYGAAGALQGGEIIAGSRVEIVFHNGACYLMSTSSGPVPVGSATKSNHAVQLGQLQNTSLNLSAAQLNSPILNLATGGGVASAYSDAANDFIIRTGASNAYQYSTFAANGLLTIPSLSVTGAATFNSTATGQTPTTGDLSTKLATTAYVYTAMPAGALLAFAGPNIPAGFLLANGAAVSRSSYANLFAAIGTTYGAGDGSTTFNLPDARGVFLRGLDNGRGLDSGRSLGSYQGDTFASHAHGVNDPGHAHGVYDPGHAHGIYGGSSGSYQGGGAYGASFGNNGNSGAGTTAGNGTGIGIYGNGTGISIQANGSGETAPKNLAVNVLIKY